MESNQKEQELIIGLHSVAEALQNGRRHHRELIATSESLATLKKLLNSQSINMPELPIKVATAHHLQDMARQLMESDGYKFKRIPSNLILVTSPTPIKSPTDIFVALDEQKERAVKIVVLDRVTDAHNAAAIMRTMAFYGADFLVTTIKGSFGLTPTFSRISSGALEHVAFVQCSSLPRFLSKLRSKDISIIGFAEEGEYAAQLQWSGGSCCLVLGSEDLGLSHVVRRILPKMVSLHSKGGINSLNVSVASAIAMERFF
ncbi:MAG: RNA methyltransferase [Bdellovibrionales bacterium]|nr:RNA methyltransferase [Bdellovibrionales bacterium]